MRGNASKKDLGQKLYQKAGRRYVGLKHTKKERYVR